jgi:hypothetical protein
MVMDPLQENDIKLYEKNMQWVTTTEKGVREENYRTKVDVEIFDEILI